MTAEKGRVWEPAFLAALAATGNVSEAARAANIVRQEVYRYREMSETFAAAWDAALEEATDTLEAEALKRAKAGSDVLLIFLLKGARPEKYRERYDTKISGSLDVNAAILNAHKQALGGS